MTMVTKTYRIHGLVQGVGFRPFVAEQANIYGVGGSVKNTGGEVLLTLVGNEEAVDVLVRRLLQLDGMDPALPGAHVTGLDEVSGASAVERVDEVPGAPGAEGADEVPGAPGAGGADEVPGVPGAGGASGGRKTFFSILPSSDDDDVIRILPPDIATCKRCESELFDRMNRRYRHPFISCVSCGPRYTIMESVPYDREHTSMNRFRMCPECREEYVKEGDLRRHAQTIACKSCGPILKAIAYRNIDGNIVERGKSASEVAVRDAVEMLRKGGIVAMKNVGGYHFTCMAGNPSAVKRLREMKARDEKPFAVMFPDVAAVEKVARVGSEEEQLLTSPARPIVLLEGKENDGVLAPQVGGDSNRVGAMLPADPVQMLIVKELGALVMTSGNLGGEPIMTDDRAVMALAREGVCDLVLYHDRRIVQGLDDSVYQVVRTKGRVLVKVLRRARGLVPQPLYLDRRLPCDSFAAGGDLKAVFALGRHDAVFMSGHFGDLYEASAEERRREAVEHMKGLLGIVPVDHACDMHPDYVSSRQFEAYLPKKVQHHRAHVLSVIAEHHLAGRVIGVAFDGTGYGDDGTVWGGEFFLYEGGNCRRLGHLDPVPMSGGDAVARDALLPLEGYISAAVKSGYLHVDEHPFGGDSGTHIRRAALLKSVGVVASSSMGRLFDAAAAILGLGTENHFEGQLACRLEYAAERFEKKEGSAADEGEADASSRAEMAADEGVVSEGEVRREDDIHLEIPIREENDEDGNVILVADVPRLVSDLIKARNAAYERYGKSMEEDGENPSRLRRGLADEMDALAYAFHEAVACMTVSVCAIMRDNAGGGTQVALSGGTFANDLLLRLLLPRLEEAGFDVYTNEKVPCGDGGLALGQMYALTF